MLKYLPIAATLAVTNLALIAASTFQTSPALAIIVQDSTSSAPAQDRNQKPDRINAGQKSEVRAIYQTLTQFYRGLNEGNVDRVVKTATQVSAKDKEYLRNVFAKVKSAGINVNIEVKNIELTSFSGDTALLKVYSISQANKGAARGSSIQSATDIALVKDRGQWKISDMRNIAQALNNN
jgi:ketosteroid isomerase-like protein